MKKPFTEWRKSGGIPTFMWQNYLVFALLILIACSQAMAQRQMENLDRGIIAIHTASDSVYIGWRMLGTEPDEIAFNLYRQSGNEKPVKLNKKPITESTNFKATTVNLQTDNSYYVKAVLKGKELEKSKSYTLKANSPVQQYINIPLKTPAGYTLNDASAGDLDGDGEYEIILHQTGRSIDTPSTGISGIPIFQAYKTNGTFLWEIKLGRNIREGAHYTQFMVYDLDGDGISEFACKTADGTIDGIGKVIGDSTKDWRNLDKNSGPFYGKILDGPEFFTIFSGSTGEALATTNYIPDRFPLNGWNGHGGSAGLFTMKGEMIGEIPSSTNFLIWWDGDLSRELLDGNHIDKYKVGRIFTAEGCISNNGSKSTPSLSADLFGDWREEVIFRTTDNKNLRIYTTVIPTKQRIRTLMHDPQYRLAVATQNVAYNQPPNTSFFLGTGMKKAPKPEIMILKPHAQKDK